MRRRLFSSALLLAGACAGPPLQKSDDALHELERLTTVAIQRKDAAMMGGLVTDDFVFRAPGQPDLGRARFLQALAEQTATITAISSDEVRVTRLGETAVITGVQRVRFKLPDATEQSGASAFVDVCAFRGGRWQIALAHNSELASH